MEVLDPSNYWCCKWFKMFFFSSSKCVANQETKHLAKWGINTWYPLLETFYFFEMYSAILGHSVFFLHLEVHYILFLFDKCFINLGRNYLPSLHLQVQCNELCCFWQRKCYMDTSKPENYPFWKHQDMDLGIECVWHCLLIRCIQKCV